MERTLAISIGKYDAHQIEKTFYKTARTEFRFSELARMMGYRNFRNAETLPICERRQKAVKLSVNLQTVGNFFAICFQPAIKIVQFNPTEKARDRIEKFAWSRL